MLAVTKPSMPQKARNATCTLYTVLILQTRFLSVVGTELHYIEFSRIFITSKPLCGAFPVAYTLSLFFLSSSFSHQNRLLAVCTDAMINSLHIRRACYFDDLRLVRAFYQMQDGFLYLYFLRKVGGNFFIFAQRRKSSTFYDVSKKPQTMQYKHSYNDEAYSLESQVVKNFYFQNLDVSYFLEKIFKFVLETL